MKKILEIIPYPFKKDGLTKIALSVYEENKDLFSFSFASPFEGKNEIAEELLSAGCEVFVLPQKKDVRAYMAAIRDIVRRGRFDAVHIHGNSALMYFEAKPAKDAGAVVITHCHSTSAGNRAAHYLLKKAFNRCADVKIGCSDPACAWAYSGEGIVSVRNGIDPSAFRFDGRAREDLRRSFGIGREPVIGFVGRFTEQKNPFFLAEIFRAFSALEPDAVLLAVGEGELFGDFVKKTDAEGLSDRILLPGTTDDVCSFLQAMDILVMPSRFEGLPLVPLEAQANGLPVLLSDVCAKETFATDLIFPMPLSAGPAAWAERIREILRTAERGADREEELRAAGLTEQQMMEKIRSLLISCTGAEEGDGK